MAKRITLERVLRDDNDDTGQSSREWTLSIEDGHISIKGHTKEMVLMIRDSDVDQLHDDLLTLISH